MTLLLPHIDVVMRERVLSETGADDPTDKEVCGQSDRK